MKLNLKNTLFRFSSLTLVLTAAASAQVDLIQLKLDAIERLSGFSGSGQRFAGAVSVSYTHLTLPTTPYV